jgi:hypothetical protein
MLETLVRKARQVAADPVLRRWLAGRLAGRWPGEPPYRPHRPPYLDDLPPLVPVAPRGAFAVLAGDPPRGPVELPLPGLTLRLDPGDEASLFERDFADTETLLALHRFAWLPLFGNGADPAWVNALWRAWRDRFGAPSDGWAWHPYTAAERAINLLDYGRRAGLPGPLAETVMVLAAHGPAIAARLEYFGDHHTSNHLAADGRGLYLLGLALDLPRCAEMGARILLAEAARIFRPSGVLREGSSHYHLLLTRQYTSAWLAACRHGRPEAAELETVVRRCLAVLPHLALPGGLPLVGDLSPDCPPEFLAGLLPGGETGGGWTGLLPGDERAALTSLRNGVAAVEAEPLRRDGWLRVDFAPWAGLWHLDPDGWPHMPGHGHQDAGGFEVHHGSEPLFIDPGRGAYGETGEAALYRSGAVHNTILIDDGDPYPPNRPYYDKAFRRAVGGPPPEMVRTPEGVEVRHHGFARLSGVGTVTRRWRFEGRLLFIEDGIEGEGTHTVTRLLHTPLVAEAIPGGALIRGGTATFRLAADAPLGFRPVVRWTAYGVGKPATALVLRGAVRLPWRGLIAVEAA